MTIFYEFQSNLNGQLANVTTNVAKTYSNGQQVSLGAYQAICQAGVTPFTVNCPGSLITSATSQFNVLKGRFAIIPQFTVTAGQWIAIGATGKVSGLDLNETNGTCGDTTSGICANGMQYSTGAIPSVLSNTAGCTATNSPCNTVGISSTGLWAFIIGNIVAGGITPITALCTNNFAQLDCLLPAMSNGLCSVVTAGCQTSGSLFWVIMLAFLGLIVATVGMSSAHITRFIGAGEVFLFLFMGWFFIFAGIGLIQSFVIIFFLFIGATVFGKTARNYF